VSKPRIAPKPNLPMRFNDKRPPQRDWIGRNRLDEATRQELRKRKLCFSCQKPWVLGHRCAGKAKAHYIEVYSDSWEEEDEDEQEHEEDSPAPGAEQASMENMGEIIESLSRVPRFHTFRMRGGL